MKRTIVIGGVMVWALAALAALVMAEDGNAETAKAEVGATQTVTFEATPVQKQLHELCQQYRASSGRGSQELDAECCRIAQRWAENMARRHSMYHGGGEQIIAYGYPTASNAMIAWRNSGGHRAWLLSGTNRAGWGYAVASNGTPYWAGAFRRGEVVTVTVREETTTTSGGGTQTATACTTTSCSSGGQRGGRGGPLAALGRGLGRLVGRR